MMDKLLKRNNDGVVEYRVTETDDKKKQVTRIYPGAVFNDQVLLARFKERVAVLNQSNIAGIPNYSVDVRADGMVFLTRDFLEGKTLQSILRENRLTPDLTRELILKIATILANLHKEGIVFGNLTPRSIIILEDGSLQLINIRLLESLPENYSFTEEHFSYMAEYLSPEVAMGESGGKSADLYSLGIILYEMLHGYTPFHHDDPVMVAWGHVNRFPEIDIESPRLVQLIELLLRKDHTERLSDVTELIRLISDDNEKVPALPNKHETEIKEHYLTYLKERYLSGLNNSKTLSFNASLFAVLLLIVFLLPVIWMIDLNNNEINYSIERPILFRESFNHFYSPQLMELPEVDEIHTSGEEAIIHLKLQKDNSFLKKIEGIFSSNTLPRCELDLSGSREIRVRFNEAEMNQQISLALSILSDKIHSRLRRENISNYQLKSETEGNLILEFPKEISVKAAENLFSGNQLSIHLLINGTNEAGIISSSEILLENSIEARFNQLLFADMKTINKQLPNSNVPSQVFWNILGTLNLQQPPHQVRDMVSPIPVMISPLPEQSIDFTMSQIAAKFTHLVVSKESIVNESVLSGSRIRLTQDRKFIFQLGSAYREELAPLSNSSHLPLILASGKKALAIIFNPNGLSIDQSIIYGFKSESDLFIFANLFQAAIPTWVKIH